MDQFSDMENSEVEQEQESSRALELKFSIGYNSAMTGAVHNLTIAKSQTKITKEIFFPSAHTGVIYNYETGESKLLQGHCNAITAVATIYDQENDKRLIVTADSGKNAAILIWDADTGTVESSIFRAETDEVISIDFSKNCYYIAFLAHQKNEQGEVEVQKIYIYDWKPKGQSEQIYYTEFGCNDGEIYYDLKFNPNMDYVMEFLVTSPNKIFFSVLNPTDSENSRAYYPHPLDESRADKKNGVTFTQSIFLQNNQKGNTAITGTTGGYIIVWDVCEALCKEDEVKTDRRKIKTVDLLGKYKKDKDKKGSTSEKDHINILVNYKNYIVIGSGGGTINFYDYNFIIVRWFENVCWMIKSVSFDFEYIKNKNPNERDYYFNNDNDDAGNTSNFKCLPFITSDISATVKRVYNIEEEKITYSDEPLKYEEIYKGIESEITSIAVHPKQNLIAIGTRGLPPKNLNRKTNERQKEMIIKEKKFEYRAYVQLFYYPNHMKHIKRENQRREDDEENKKRAQKGIGKNDKKKTGLYPGKTNNAMHTDNDNEGGEERYANSFKRVFAVDTYPTVLEFSPCDNTLMVGTSFQKIIPLNINNLSGPLPDKQTILQIKEIADKEDKNAEIKEIKFSPDNKHFAATDNLGRIGVFRIESGIWSLVGRFHFLNNIISFCFNEDGGRLFTITADRILTEFKINQDNKDVKQIDNYTLEKLHTIKIEDDCNMTSIVWYPLTRGKEKNILISNDQYKVRIVNVFDQPTITKTALGPCFGGPIVTMRVLPGKDPEKRLIAFITKEKIMGLISLPVDGNPYRYMGVIAHPGQIKDIKTSQNMNYIFTTGGSDYTINIWKYNANPLVEAVQNGGIGIEPFLNLLEGGRDGIKYKEMVDFFYYAQIKSKDEHTTKHRILDQTVTINLIHGLLASLGYYPSNEEITNIQKEVRHAKLLENAKEKNDDINFETFVKIYLNHRPYVELDVDKIESSFNNLQVQTKYHTVHEDPNDTIIIKKQLIDVLRNKMKIDEQRINNIITLLDGNASKESIFSMEHYQQKVSRENFLTAMRDNRIEDKEINEILDCLVTDGNINNLPSYVIYKIRDRLISRENFLHMLKENGEKMEDKEIGEILRVLVGDPNPNNLPPMLSFDYIFENILLMEREEKEVIQ